MVFFGLVYGAAKNKAKDIRRKLEKRVDGWLESRYTGSGIAAARERYTKNYNARIDATLPQREPIRGQTVEDYVDGAPATSAGSNRGA